MTFDEWFDKTPLPHNLKPVAEAAWDAATDRAANNITAIIDLSARLAAKLDECHSSPQYKAVWELYAAHGYTYKGPQYNVELDALKALLSKAS